MVRTSYQQPRSTLIRTLYTPSWDSRQPTIMGYFLPTMGYLRLWWPVLLSYLAFQVCNLYPGTLKVAASSMLGLGLMPAAFLADLIQRDPKIAAQASFRALCHESYAVVTSEMRQRLVKSEDPPSSGENG